MNIIQAQKLGIVGEDIIVLLNEIKDAVKDREDFEDQDHQLEYVEESCNQVKELLTRLRVD